MRIGPAGASGSQGIARSGSAASIDEAVSYACAVTAAHSAPEVPRLPGPPQLCPQLNWQSCPKCMSCVRVVRAALSVRIRGQAASIVSAAKQPDRPELPQLQECREVPEVQEQVELVGLPEVLLRLEELHSVRQRQTREAACLALQILWLSRIASAVRADVNYIVMLAVNVVAFRPIGDWCA